MTTLYKLNNNNRISWWKIEIEGSDYHITWGQDLATIDQPTACHNAYNTPSPERAAFEAESRINEQIKRCGYSTTKPTTVPDRPMLAQTWEDHSRKVKDGKRKEFQEVLIQPKLDGMRCIATNTQMLTRRAERITSCPHIQELLSHISPEYKLDGELYIHGTDLQTIQSYTRRDRPHRLHKLVQFHVFDLVDTTVAAFIRYQILGSIVDELKRIYKELYDTYNSVPEKLRSSVMPEECPIQLVPSLRVPNTCHSAQTQMMLKQLHKTYTKEGYEGCMIKNAHGVYELNYRSPDILKYKLRLDAEFEIIDISEGYNKTGIFVCCTEDNQIFEATPAWTVDRKRHLLRNKDRYIGRYVTVEYEKMSRDGVPLKPVAKTTREVVDKEPAT